MGRSNLLDGRPAPVAPIVHYPQCRLIVRCPQCGRQGAVPIGPTVRRFRLPRDMAFYELANRLRCQQCGMRPPRALRVEGWSRW